jgi:short subunit dehydrogenase-like uncharacterized protein
VNGEREVDIAIFGATGFVGKLLARYLARHAPRGTRIALAGRDRERLAGVRAELGQRAAKWPLMLANAAEPSSLAALAAASRVLVTTVGPYRARGLPLVEACVGAKTHYADLTGEVLFMRESIDRCHDAAARAGVRIVHACGFDSIPSDLGVLLLHEIARRDGTGTLGDTTYVLRGVRGGVSGGTIASMKGLFSEMQSRPEVIRIIGDPYALSPNRSKEPDLGSQRELEWPAYDAELGMWIGPFVMAPTNTRVVRRSNALQRWAYGRRFRYREVTGFGNGLRAPLMAAAVSGGLAAFFTGMRFAPARAVLDRMLPQPGAGPKPETQRRGFFRVDVHTRTTRGIRYLARVSAKGDPGYGATSVMLGETALCLALDHDRLPDRAGVLTPATAMGTVLVERLRAAGQTLKAERVSDR